MRVIIKLRRGASQRWRALLKSAGQRVKTPLQLQTKPVRGTNNFSQEILRRILIRGFEEQVLEVRLGASELDVSENPAPFVDFHFGINRGKSIGPKTHAMSELRQNGGWSFRNLRLRWTLTAKQKPKKGSLVFEYLKELGFWDVGDEDSRFDEIFHQLTTSGVQILAKRRRKRTQVRKPKLKDLIFLERAPKTLEKTRWDQIIRQRSSTISGPGLATITDIGAILDLGFSQISDGKFKYPSAGGLYSVKIILNACAIEGIASGLYLYHPSVHALERLSGHSLGAGIGSFGLISDMKGLDEKYRSIPYRLALLDTGVVYHQLSLVLACLHWQGHAMGWVRESLWRSRLGHRFEPSWRVTGEYKIAGRETIGRKFRKKRDSSKRK